MTAMIPPAPTTESWTTGPQQACRRGVGVFRAPARPFFLVLCLLCCLPGAAGAGVTNGHSGNRPVHVPDTGQTACYDNLRRIECPSPGAPFYGQDAEYRTEPPRCERRTVAGASLIVDLVTGLMWQAQAAEGEHDWSGALDQAAALSLGGFTDWRLPESRELRTIMAFGRPQQEEGKECRFPVPPGNPCFWSITTRKYPALDAQSVCLDGINQVEDTNKAEKRWVRAVRGTPLPGPLFRDNGDGTVSDLSTGLMWQQGESRPMTWEQALSFCEGLDLAGHQDWRLPSIRELQTLIDARLKQPALDTGVFPGCRPEPYWSSTTRSDRPAFAWTMDFATGREYDGGYKIRFYPVRAVRGGHVQHRHPAGETVQPLPPDHEDQRIRPFPRTQENGEHLEPYPLDM